MTQEAPHPISLEQVLFTRCIVISLPGHVPQPGMVATGPVNSLTVTKLEGPDRRYSALMRAELNAAADNSQPYQINMECLAVLSVDDTLEENEALRGVYITANSVLYGAIRESVAWLTSRQPYGSLVLGLSVLRPTPPAEPLPGP
ncbi:hypothetical protein [Polaromonas sp. CG_23.6]|uniref:hypothetical protein n=1 Tax=Polaromonas sp. CG_23.6 TaxID=2760709 RepID=UPI0024754DFA|nr:hypothetical protein [Polaromonas sp. CG_23.6]MDH6185507.1 hypothetical protein [Polaromonas sp. CG_23.6]